MTIRFDLVMTLTLNFQVKYGICYILWQNDPMATKWKMNKGIEHYASNGAISFFTSVKVVTFC